MCDPRLNWYRLGINLKIFDEHPVSPPPGKVTLVQHNLNYLLRLLHAFNLGPSFIQWLRVLYNNASSCVMNNGFTTGPFALRRGVRHGKSALSLPVYNSFGDLSYKDKKRW